MNTLEKDLNEKKGILIRKKLAKPIQLPSLAKNIHILMHILADETMDYQQLAKVIKHYPEIAVRLIFLANSSWSAPVSPIETIEQACLRLGTSIVKSVSIAISIASSFDISKSPSFKMVDFWTTSMLVADGAGMLASKFPSQTTNIEFEHKAQTAGILHNLGLLWMVDNFPLEVDQAIHLTAKSSSLPIGDSLKKIIGADYCEVGGWIAKKLKLPEVLVIAMEHHNNNEYQGEFWETALLVGSSAHMVSAVCKKADKITTNTRLEILGLDSSLQNEIFLQLSKNLEKKRELANVLLEGII